jgi:hypothetical protein
MQPCACSMLMQPGWGIQYPRGMYACMHACMHTSYLVPATVIPERIALSRSPKTEVSAFSSAAFAWGARKAEDKEQHGVRYHPCGHLLGPLPIPLSDLHRWT